MIHAVLLVTAILAADPESGLHATVGRKDTRITFVVEGAATVVDVTSAFGIDKATIERKSDAWPKAVLVRLHLSGLESFKAIGKEATVEWSVSSTDEHESRVSLISGKREAAITKESPYYGAARIVGGERKIPLKEGYFEVALPAKLFEENPPQITLAWIDFYR